MDIWDKMHGRPLNNCEVATKVNSSFSLGLGRDWRGEKRFLGFNAPKPILELGLMIVGPIKYKCDFYTLLG